MNTESQPGDDVTIALGSNVEVMSGPSRPKVDIVSGSQPEMATETADLLRRRLLAISMIFVVALVIALVRDLLQSADMQGPFPIFRIGVLLTIAAISVGLWRVEGLPLNLMRVVEIVVFGLVGFQLILMFGGEAILFARTDNQESMIGLLHQDDLAWTLVIVIYGMFMPVTWKRAAIVVFPMALIPEVVELVLPFIEPAVDGLRERDRSDRYPMTLLAALAATVCAHVVHSTRSEAYRARRFAQYRLREMLGKGGMGEVYKAEHVLLKRDCAIKLIRKDEDTDERALVRFEREVRATAKLTHWNTIEIFDYGRTDDGTFYYVMEYLPGMSLDEIVKKYGRVPLGRAVHFLVQTCHALKEAHAMGLIHRDIKPANIFSAERGGTFDVSKLLDFGLVKQDRAAPTEMEMSRLESVDMDVTLEGSFGGSPLFIPPEQVTDYHAADPRSDIYSLGCVANYLLTTRPPFPGSDLMTVLRAHAFQPAAPPSEYNPEVPDELDEIVLRCLAKSPADRFQSVTELAEALQQCPGIERWTDADAEAWWRENEG